MQFRILFLLLLLYDTIGWLDSRIPGIRSSRIQSAAAVLVGTDAVGRKMFFRFSYSPARVLDNTNNCDWVTHGPDGSPPRCMSAKSHFQQRTSRLLIIILFLDVVGNSIEFHILYTGISHVEYIKRIWDSRFLLWFGSVPVHVR